jgi:hypothetical protein
MAEHPQIHEHPDENDKPDWRSVLEGPGSTGVNTLNDFNEDISRYRERFYSLFEPGEEVTVADAIDRAHTYIGSGVDHCSVHQLLEKDERFRRPEGEDGWTDINVNLRAGHGARYVKNNDFPRERVSEDGSGTEYGGNIHRMVPVYVFEEQ